MRTNSTIDSTYILLSRDTALPAHQIRLTILLLRASVEPDRMVEAPLLALLHETSTGNATHDWFWINLQSLGQDEQSGLLSRTRNSYPSTTLRVAKKEEKSHKANTETSKGAYRSCLVSKVLCFRGILREPDKNISNEEGHSFISGPSPVPRYSYI